MISIYTDASVDLYSSNAAASCLVLEDNVFKGQTSFTYDRTCKDSGYAEVWGAIQALNYAKSICPNFDKHKKLLYTDSHSCVASANGAQSDNDARKTLDEEFVSMLVNNNVTVKYVHGHDIKHNPNKVVDSSAKRAMRVGRRK